MRVFLRLFKQGPRALENLQSLPFGETFGWTAYPPMASGRFHTANMNEAKILCGEILNLLGSGNNDPVRAHLEITRETTDRIDPNEELRIPFRQIGLILIWGQKLISKHSTSNAQETIVLFEKVLELLEKNQHDMAI